MAEHGHDQQQVGDQQIWDERYRSAPAIWSGHPNTQLVAEAADLPPGRALDAGAGEGADALWLAEHGWRVTAVDLSQVALDRAAAEAARRGLADRVRCVQADLGAWEPPVAAFDLVSAQFLHPTAAVRDALYARLAAAVAPGGTLLLVGHDAGDLRSGLRRPHGGDRYVGADVLAGALDPARWEVLVAEARPRTAVHDGEEHQIADAVLRARRRD